MSKLGTSLSFVALCLLAGCVAPADEEEVAEAGEDHLIESTTPAAGSKHDCPLLVVGGGTGGVAAALAATRTGAKVCLTEETDWVGGQLTAQGLNASDDSRFTDSIGSTRSYRRLRAAMRARYGGRSNPGGCWVSHLCAEPKVALDVIGETLKPAIASGALRIFTRVVPAAMDVRNGKVAGATMERVADGGKFTISARQTIDATELGDVLKLAGAGYRVGQEPRSDTGEADAPEQGCAECVQSITYDVVLEKRPESERHVIAKPEGYGVKPWMKGFAHEGFSMFGAHGVWTYRRIVDGGSLGRTDLSIMNWSVNPQRVGGNDYPFGSVVEVSREEQKEQFARARQRALAYVYWLQTEADGHGYPFLKLRSDVLGTTDGVAKYPYIREGRRVRGLELVRVQDVSDFYVKNSARAKSFDSSVGIGLYPLDMHLNVVDGGGFARGHSLPFQIPMGALIPETMNGLLAGAKNIGTSHMTNSAYRLHPIEWAAGEAAGTLAAMALSWNIEPREAFADVGHKREIQDRLLSEGMPLYWIDDVPETDAAWRDIQLMATVGVMGGPEADTLHFRPEMTLNRAQAVVALVRALELQAGPNAPPSFTDVPASHWAKSAIDIAASRGIVSGMGDGTFAPQAPVTRGQLRLMIGRASSDALAQRALPPNAQDATPLNRAGCARALAAAYRERLHLP